MFNIQEISAGAVEYLDAIIHCDLKAIQQHDDSRGWFEMGMSDEENKTIWELWKMNNIGRPQNNQQ